MALWRNLSAGVGGSIWSAALGFAVVPFYLRLLGMEAYGLVGFFIALQAVLQMLDLGLAPTFSREVARADATGSMREARNLHRTLEYFYWTVAIAIGIAVIAAAPLIAAEWLQASQIPRETIERAVALMGVVVALRFPAGLYMGALQGRHRVDRASAVSTVAITAGHAGALALLMFVAPTIEVFLGWQLVVAMAQVVAMRAVAWRTLGGRTGSRASLASLQRIWRFTATLSIVAVLGIVFAQLDKFVLSRLVTLEELGQYTVATTVARSLVLVTSPVISVMSPRFAALAAAGNAAGLEAAYKNGTTLALAVLFPLAAVVGLFAAPLVTIWTGNAQLADSIAPTIQLLLAGFALNGAMFFPYSLQLAYGQARMAAFIVVCLIVGFVPLLWWLAHEYGIVGAAAAWLALHVVYLPFGTWLTHRTILPGVGQKWVLEGVGRPAALTAAIVGLGYVALTQAQLPTFATLVGAACLVPMTVLAVVAGRPVLAEQVVGAMRQIQRSAMSRDARRSGFPPSVNGQ